MQRNAIKQTIASLQEIYVIVVIYYATIDKHDSSIRNIVVLSHRYLLPLVFT